MKTLKKTARDLWQAGKRKSWRLFLRTARAVTLAVDDWIQREEVRLRDAAMADTSAAALAKAEVDPVQSAIREKAIRKVARVKKERRARLVYQHGQFVEVR